MHPVMTAALIAAERKVRARNAVHIFKVLKANRLGQLQDLPLLQIPVISVPELTHRGIVMRLPLFSELPKPPLMPLLYILRDDPARHDVKLGSFFSVP